MSRLFDEMTRVFPCGAGVNLWQVLFHPSPPSPLTRKAADPSLDAWRGASAMASQPNVDSALLSLSEYQVGRFG